MVLSPEMGKKLKVLEYFGFKPNDPSVKATVMNMYPREHYYKYRTKMFQTEKDRINAYQSKIKRNRSSDNNKSYDSLQDYDGSELYEKVYEEPVPFIPYAHKETSVKPWGFVRD